MPPDFVRVNGWNPGFMAHLRVASSAAFGGAKSGSLSVEVVMPGITLEFQQRTSALPYSEASTAPD